MYKMRGASSARTWIVNPLPRLALRPLSSIMGIDGWPTDAAILFFLFSSMPTRRRRNGFPSSFATRGDVVRLELDGDWPEVDFTSILCAHSETQIHHSRKVIVTYISGEASIMFVIPVDSSMPARLSKEDALIFHSSGSLPLSGPVSKRWCPLNGSNLPIPIPLRFFWIYIYGIRHLSGWV